MTYSKYSPYSNTKQTTWYLGQMEYKSIPAHGTDQFITIESMYEHRPDLLAEKLYGTTELWWIFAMRNSETIVDPIYDLVAGLTIWTPTKTRIEGLM